MTGRRRWILAIRVRQFGDVLATLGALRAVKRSEPARSVAFVADAAYHELLERFDFIDLLLPTPPSGVVDYARYVAKLRSLEPAVTLDFHGSARSAVLTRLSGAPVRAGFDVRVRKAAYTIVEPRAEFENGQRLKRTSLGSALALARHAGAGERGDGLIPEIPVGAPEIERARRVLRDCGVPGEALSGRSVVGLNPGRPYPAKEWPAGRFAALAKRLVSSGRVTVILWGPGEREAAEAIAHNAGSGVFVAPAVTLSELPAVLKLLAGVVTIDSGLKHLAVSARVPTVTLFGSTDPREWHMGGDADRVLWKGYSCSPCRRLDCPMGAPCMDFSVDEVVAALDTTEGFGWTRAESR